MPTTAPAPTTASSTFPWSALAPAFPEFEIDPQELGPGGFKAVHRATRDGEEVVLKICKEPIPLQPGEIEPLMPPRFAREIDAMKRINSPRVVSVLEGPETRSIDGTDRLWYLEPYLAGGNLAERLETDGAWPRDDVLRLYLGLLEGVAAVSAAGLVHRDIKPRNIVFDDAGDPVLLDLGVALHVNLPALTASSDVAPLTWAFAAPEQFDAHRDAILDVRTDLFLVGLTAYCAWTNAHPFRPGLPDYLRRLRAGEIDTGPLAGDLDDPLAQAILRLLRPELHQRYRSPDVARAAVVGVPT